MSIPKRLRTGLFKHRRWNPQQAILRSMILALSSVSGYAQTVGVQQVAVAPARTATVPNTIKLVGTIDPYARSLLASEVAGLVEKMEADHGDRLQSFTPRCYLWNAIYQLPLSLMTGASSELYRGLAAVMVGGLFCSTLFTLILGPVVFSMFLHPRIVILKWLGREETAAVEI